MSCSSPAPCAAERGSDGITRRSQGEGRGSAPSGFQPFPFLPSEPAFGGRGCTLLQPQLHSVRALFHTQWKP